MCVRAYECVNAGALLSLRCVSVCVCPLSLLRSVWLPPSGWWRSGTAETRASRPEVRNLLLTNGCNIHTACTHFKFQVLSILAKRASNTKVSHWLNKCHSLSSLSWIAFCFRYSSLLFFLFVMWILVRPLDGFAVCCHRVRVLFHMLHTNSCQLKLLNAVNNSMTVNPGRRMLRQLWTRSQHVGFLL